MRCSRPPVKSMQYHIDTIPVWDALRSGSGCLFCTLRASLEIKAVDYYLGGSVMEPDIRIKVNEKGFCSHHHLLLSEQKNKLGHALMMLSHTDEVLSALEQLSSSGLNSAAKKPLFRVLKASRAPEQSSSRVSDALSALSSSCVICDDIQENMDRYAYTFMHLYKNDTAFRKEFSASSGVCLPDAVFLINAAEKHLAADRYNELTSLLISKLKENLAQTRADLEYFTQKFDYRNADKPWGNSRKALERTVNLLQGRCYDTEK